MSRAPETKKAKSESLGTPIALHWFIWPFKVATVLFWSKFQTIRVPFFEPTTAYFSSEVKLQTEASEVNESFISKGLSALFLLLKL